MREVSSVWFANRPLLELGDDDRWTLARRLDVKVFFKSGAAEWVLVEEGFSTDLASVPRLPGLFMLFGDRARRAAIVHDWLYERGRDRDEADAIFYAAMESECDGVTRAAMWLGVRAFGWMFWREGKP